jgi:predicted AAA+ superfamily ATPase
MPLRPALERAKEKLLGMLCSSVDKPGANSSYLLIGARGTGKTLVRRSNQSSGRALRGS